MSYVHFLYDHQNYEKNRADGSLLQSGMKLETALPHEGKSDIDLFTELALVSTLIKSDKLVHVIDILNAIQSRNMENLVPNVVIASRSLSTIPVSVYQANAHFPN